MKERIIANTGTGFLWLVALTIVAVWFWGIPYIPVLIFKGDYWTYATVWLSVLLVRNIYGRILAQNVVKQLTVGNEEGEK